jgi:hypothetical protein
MCDQSSGGSLSAIIPCTCDTVESAFLFALHAFTVTWFLEKSKVPRHSTRWIFDCVHTCVR